MLIFSGTEHLAVLEDKLSTTTVVFFRSEGKLTQHFQLIRFNTSLTLPHFLGFQLPLGSTL